MNDWASRDAHPLSRLASSLLICVSIFAANTTWLLVTYYRYLESLWGGSPGSITLLLFLMCLGLASGVALATRWLALFERPLLYFAIVATLTSFVSLVFHDYYLGLQVGPGVQWIAASIVFLISFLPGACAGFLWTGHALLGTDNNPDSSQLPAITIGGALGLLFINALAPDLPDALTVSASLNLALAVMVYQVARIAGHPEISEPIVNKPGAWLANLFATGFCLGVVLIILAQVLDPALGPSFPTDLLITAILLAGIGIGRLLANRVRVNYRSRTTFLLGVGILFALLMSVIGTTCLDWLRGELATNDNSYLIYTFARYLVIAAVTLPAGIGLGLAMRTESTVIFRDTWIPVGLLLGAGAGLLISRLFLISFVTPGLLTALTGTVIILISIAGLMRTGDPRRTAIIGSGLVCIAAGFALSIDKSDTLLYRSDGENRITITRSGTDLIYNHSEYGASRISPTGELNADHATARFLGMLPALLHPAPARVASLGHDTGLTASTLVLGPDLSHLAIVGSRPGLSAMEVLYPDAPWLHDSRVTVSETNARTYLTRFDSTFDIIMINSGQILTASQPLSVEYFRLVKQRLATNGLLIQGFPVEGASLTSFFSVINALQVVFDHVEIYLATDQQWVIIAGANTPGLVLRGWDSYENVLAEIAIDTPDDFAVRRLTGDEVLRQAGQLFPVIHSDMSPLLDAQVDRDSYMGKNTIELVQLGLDPLPQTGIIEGSIRVNERRRISSTRPTYNRLQDHAWLAQRTMGQAQIYLRELVVEDCEAIDMQVWEHHFMVLMDRSSHLTPTQLERIERVIRPECSYPRLQAWWHLLFAIQKRDLQTMLATTDLLMILRPPGTPLRRTDRFLINTAVVALTGLSQPAKSLEIIAKYRLDTLDQPLPRAVFYRYLLSRVSPAPG